MNARSLAYPLIDSLRALAVLAVMALHAVGIYALGSSADSFLAPFLARLDVGAWAFFAISGLVLYRPWVRARFEDRPPPATGAYAWRRAVRILPPYWLALLLTAVWLGREGILTPDGIPTYWLFGQVYSAATMAGGVPQAWTLAVEVSFYVLLPVWALTVRRFGRGASTPAARLRGELKVIGAVAALSLVYKVVVLWSDAAGEFTPSLHPLLTPLPGYLDVFAVGMAIAAITSAPVEARPAWTRSARLWDSAGPWWLAAAALFVAAGLSSLDEHPVAGYSHVQFMAQHLVNLTIAALLVAPLAFGPQDRGLLRRALALRPLLWLGMLSYGIYLSHLLVLGLLGRAGWGDSVIVHPYLHWMVACLVLSTAAAAVSWYGLERPLQKLRSLGPGRRDPRGPGPPVLPGELTGPEPPAEAMAEATHSR